MAQPFDCICGKGTCRGRISGARDMAETQLQGVWLNGHIREMLEEQRNLKKGNSLLAAKAPENGTAGLAATDPTAAALKDALQHAEKVVEAAKLALISYVQAMERAGGNVGSNGLKTNGHGSGENGLVGAALGAESGLLRRGPTSRELSGEMGGDTVCI
jgi:hypothetical protein